MQKQRWDIFCRIVDNYGDIGVCWRLARQLAHEYGLSVRLWVDDLAIARRLINGLDTQQARQTVDGVEICHWQEFFDECEVAQVVIEAFACELPESYLAAMVKTKPIGLNLEYLSAEAWAVDAHSLASPHPTLPLTKHFFFPGFDPKSGGLIREQSLLEKRDAFLSSPQAQSAFWKKLGLANNPSLKISLFFYPHAPLQGLLQAIAGGTRPAVVFVPDSAVLGAIGNIESKGNLTLQALPFLSQDDYDCLLWACDINFVRGEDSWVRALWAGKPMIWQPYLQAEDAHLLKLKAFLDVYDCNEVLHACHLHWCDGSFSDADWQSLLSQIELLQEHALMQSAQLASQPDLAAKLVIFCENLSK